MLLVVVPSGEEDRGRKTMVIGDRKGGLREEDDARKKGGLE